MRILRCNKHKASKNYMYYNGVILKGSTYYRGFAIAENNMPFEFMFTDSNIYQKEKINQNILINEFRIYYGWRKKLCN